jgi:hypothetical protein
MARPDTLLAVIACAFRVGPRHKHPHVHPMTSFPFRVGRSYTGLGLFATEPIAKGKRIVEYTGPRLTNKEAEAIEEGQRGARYLFEVNTRWTIDGSPRSNIARYANHSCRPNADPDIVRGRIFIKSIKNIKPGDEITYNYGEAYFDAFLKPVGCKCAWCRDQRALKRAAARAKTNGKAAPKANGKTEAKAKTKSRPPAKSPPKSKVKSKTGTKAKSARR